MVSGDMTLTNGVMMNFVNAVAKENPGFRKIFEYVKKAVGGGISIGMMVYLSFLIQYKIKQNFGKTPMLPGPTPLPIIGSLHLMAQKFGPDGNPLVHVALMDLGKKYNGIYGLYLGSGYTVVITKPSVAEEAFCTHQLKSGYIPRGELATDRCANQSHGGHHVPTMYIMTRDGKGIAMSTGSYWKRVRGRLVAHVTSKKIAELNEYMVKEEVCSVVAEWARKIKRGEKIDNLTGQLKRESMNMAMRLLFSKRYGANQPQDYKDLQYCVEYFFCNLSSGNPSDMIPMLRAFPNKLLREFERVSKLRDDVLGRLIAEHKAEWLALRDAGKMSDRKDARDMLDQFFFDQEDGFESKDQNGKSVWTKLTADEVHVCIWDIVFAMTDTTATTNEWMIYFMINNPVAQAKVHEELDRVVGPNRLPVLSDKPNLPYFWAMIKEVMRSKIVSPVMAPHYAVEDMTLHDTNGKEFFIPRGTALFMHGYSMGLDPELWDKPEEFRPERWFSKRNEGLGLYGQQPRAKTEHYKFMPFSIGPRMCPGYSFANVAQFIQSATIMHCFRWKLSDDARDIAVDLCRNGKLDCTENWGLTIMPRRYGEMGLVSADARPAARFGAIQPGDVDFQHRFLRKDEKKAVKLVKKEVLSKDTALLRFAFPDTTMVLGLPVGKHFKIFMPNIMGKEVGKWNGRDDAEALKNEIERSYTPTSADKDMGFVDLVVKFYRPGAVERFPDGGKLSQQLDNMFVGDEMLIQGPFGRIEYLGNSKFKVGSKHFERPMVGMMAGGSGITPMLQILDASLPNDEDITQYSLIYANQTPEDILLREKLEALAEKYPEKFKLHYTVDRAGEDWNYSVGFIDEAMIKAHMPPPSDDTIILMCGPPPMIQFACKKNLDTLGYDKDIQVTF